jgi:hypothetical protein
MSDAPIQIRNLDVVRSIRALAERTGQPITDAVAEAVRAELRRWDAVDEQAFQRRMRAIDEAVERFHALPVVGPSLKDDDLYDEDGLPR